MNNSTRTGVAFVVGALAGGVAALLMAPARGEKTRQRIKEAAKDTYHKGEGFVEETKESIEKGASRVAESATRNKGALREAVSEAKTAYKREMANAREDAI